MLSADADRTKCTRCSQRFGDLELVVLEHGDLYHEWCWRIARTQGLIRDSRKMITRARARLAESQRRLPGALFILIVDDDTEAAMGLRECIEDAGCAAAIAYSDPEAATIVREWAP